MNTSLSLEFYRSGNCPFCDSQYIVGGNCDSEHDYVYRDFTCESCNQEWTETYKCIELCTKAPNEQVLEVM